MHESIRQTGRSDTSGYCPLGFLPGWWEGESLYGWCSRLNTLRDDKTRSLGHLLFGREHAARLVDIPAGMGRFAHATGGLLGSTEQILKSRTVASAYWPFASEATRQQLLDAANDLIGTPIPMVLGLTASRLGAFHPLRYCAKCRRRSLIDKGYATWNIAQQLPGVWWCPTHGQTLEQVTTTRLIWRKPGDDSQPLEGPKSDAETHALTMMQVLASSLVTLEYVNTEGLAFAAIHRLRRIGVATSPARLNSTKIAAWLLGSPLYMWAMRQGGLVTMPKNNWAVPLMRGRGRSHPFKWLVLWTCAWQNEPIDSALHDFMAAATKSQIFRPRGQGRLWDDVDDQNFAADIPPEIEAAFLRATTIKDVAIELKISVGAAQQWLSDYPYFARQWLTHIREQRFSLAREHVEQVIALKTTISRSSLLKECHTDVEWLARYSPASLRSLLNRLPAKRGPQGELF